MGCSYHRSHVGPAHTVVQVMESPDAAANVLSQAKLVARATYSSPPINGARIVTEVLGDPVLRQQWYVMLGRCAEFSSRDGDMSLGQGGGRGGGLR